jgi:tRNA (mo5U34)-methyltransferase
VDTAEARRLVAGHTGWYHTMELAPGVVTPGAFDLRPVVDKMPWPDVAGRRCLDIGTFDGFLAFEMERRGAAEVVAVDLDDQRLWDWPAGAGPSAASENDTAVGTGFDIAARVLDSHVERKPISIYDLDPNTLGRFDVVVCGGLLQHLRDPVRALEAVRSVCTGWLLSAEHIDVWLTILFRRKPVARLNGLAPFADWWASNAASHARMLDSAGFRVEREARPFIVEYTPHVRPRLTPREVPARVAERLLAGGGKRGVLTHAALARPRL